MAATAVLASWAVVAATVARAVDEAVPASYMDEIFHVPLAQQYCAGRWDVWDDKVTTPPGLYVLAAAANAVVPGVCTVAGIRALNTLLGLATVPVLAALLQAIRGGRGGWPPARVWAEAAVISLFPMHYFFHFLAYTDTASTLLVLLGLLLSYRGRAVASAAPLGKRWESRALQVLFASLWFRQTNIAWLAFAAGTLLLRSRPLAASTPLSVRDATASGIVHELQRLALAAARSVRTVAGDALPFAVPVALFGAFLVWNGGIVLGDRAAHTTAVHVPQLFYFAVLAVVFSAPAFASLRATRVALQQAATYAACCRPLSACEPSLNVAWTTVRTVREAAAGPGRLRGVVMSVLAVAAIAACVHQFTRSHLYLVSDNRHWSSAAWRHLFSRHWWQRYLYVPAYAAAVWQVRRALSAQPVILVLGYAVAVALVLVPSPLVEARYFVLPYLVFRVHAGPPPSAARLAAEGALYAAVNAAVLYMFLFRPFVWPHAPGEVQRYMW